MAEVDILTIGVEAPKPARKKWVVFFVGLAVLIIIAGVGGAAYAAWQFYQPLSAGASKEISFVVKKNTGVKEIAADLEKAGLIRSAFWLETYVWLKNKSGQLMAGEYLMSPSFNVMQLVSLMTGGKVVSNEKQITFPEGFTLKQIDERLLEQGFGQVASLAKQKVGDYQLQYKFLYGVAGGATLEGFLFPDTYRFHRETSVGDIIKKFLDNFDDKITPEMRQQISEQKRSLYEVIILASIVQQEAIGEDDMSLIAGVFANRLRIGMALQSDATVNYVTGKKDRQPTWNDTKVPSPYNTYLNRGLPPGPICNPGLAAIGAAIFPTTTEYLYFLHPLDGPTVFSKTLDEHNRNKIKYLK